MRELLGEVKQPLSPSFGERILKGLKRGETIIDVPSLGDNIRQGRSLGESILFGLFGFN